MKNLNVYITEEHGEKIEYVATGKNEEKIVLSPRNCTWVRVEVTEKELDKMAVIGTLTKDEESKDFTVNNLY